MSKVFAVQNQHRYDKEKDDFVPKFDLSAAEQFGTLTYLLAPNAAPFSAASVTKELHAKLSEITSDDFLLLIGNPILIGLTVAVASIYCPVGLRLLQWHGKEQRYIAVKVPDING